MDEAYLDVSHRAESGAALALEIRRAIYLETGLTASAGIAPNKMIAKVASDWNKPDGQLEVRVEDVDGFMRGLRVAKLQGVGKKGQETLARLGIESCGDFQQLSKVEAAEKLVGDLSERDGDYVLLASFGAGFTWGSILLKWESK